MSVYEAPAKVNLALLVDGVYGNGYHRIDSVVQTIEWCDLLTVERADEAVDVVSITDPDLDPEDNLVTAALSRLRERTTVDPLAIHLEKVIPAGAGLGGGSSDAAASLVAAVDIVRAEKSLPAMVAPEIGSDVALFLVGGTMRITGRGDRVQSLPGADGFALAVAVPDFRLSTASVYRRWDEMGGPEGEVMPTRSVPPSLRDGMPQRNDLTAAALSVEPMLAEFMAELRQVWDRPVSMTGSGSACFAYFADEDEASDAARAAAPMSAHTRGASLRTTGVSRREETTEA